jgi:hypothetical protein
MRGSRAQKAQRDERKQGCVVKDSFVSSRYTYFSFFVLNWNITKGLSVNKKKLEKEGVGAEGVEVGSPLARIRRE